MRHLHATKVERSASLFGLMSLGAWAGARVVGHSICVGSYYDWKRWVKSEKSRPEGRL
jgi:hypothetical protein